MPVMYLAPDRPRHDVAGRQLGARLVGEETAALLIDENRAFAAHGLADQRHRARRPVEGGGMELHEFEVGELGARMRGNREALAEAAGGRPPLGGSES